MKIIKLGILGQKGVGKTSFINYFKNNKKLDSTVKSIDTSNKMYTLNFITLNELNIQFKVYTYSNIDVFKSKVDEIDYVLLMFRNDKLSTFKCLPDYYTQIHTDIPVILVSNCFILDNSKISKYDVIDELLRTPSNTYQKFFEVCLESSNHFSLMLKYIKVMNLVKYIISLDTEE